MPIYEYVCDNCGHDLEVIQKVSEEPLRSCPSCEQEALRKKISAAGFRLKGGGWYETDFKSGKKKNVSASDTDKSASGTNSKTNKSSGNDSNSSSSSSSSSDSSSSTAGSSSASSGSKSSSGPKD